MNENVERVLAEIKALSDAERAVLFERLAEGAGIEDETQARMPLQFAADELEGPADYVIVFDGGSHGNPGPGYGSYALIQASDDGRSITRLDFGRQMTNNEAEYESLIAALQGLGERIELAGRSPSDYGVEVRGDSALVIHQVEGTWKTNDDRMRLLRNRARELLGVFKGHRLVLQGREESVRVLGH